MLYRLLLIIDGLTIFIALGFFALRLADSSIKDYNFNSWIILLAGFGAIIGSGVLLHRNGNHTGANAILLILAAPALSVAVMILLFFVNAPSFPRWN
ncbi:MAG: hypothetical protein EXR09_07685 [Acetobacteraceae bacterium]|nr:hypothetical protein [Acetobacteraceae bacterium]